MTRPPRVASWLVRRLVAPHLADAFLGDLDELFASESRGSVRRAQIAYWRRALGAVWHLRPDPSRQGATERTSMMAHVWRDLVGGVRLFVAQPSYSVAAVVTLALAIGANSLIFTMVNLLVLRPLPLQEADRLGWILTNGPNASQDRAGVSLPEYAAYRDEAPAFDTLAARRNETATLRVGATVERVNRHVGLGDLHGVWGLSAALGRPLTAADERDGAPRVVALSHRFWTIRLAGAADVVGRAVVLDGVPHTVVGVLAPGFEFANLAEIDVWTAYQGDPHLASRLDRGWRPVGRLREGVTVAEASSQVGAISSRLAVDYPDTNRDWHSRVGTSLDAMAGSDVWVVLGLLFAVVGLLLVLACANIMNLLIARLVGRRRELAVRLALGATPGRIVGQIVCEGLVIGVAGGLVGVGVAWTGLRGIHATVAEPFFQQLRLEPRVFAFAAVLAFVTPLLFSVLPALRLVRHDPRDGLGDASARSIGGEAAGRGRSVLVVVQVSIAVMLLVVSTLMAKSVHAVLHADLGYTPSGLVSAELEVPAWMRADPLDALRLREQALARIRALPAVDAASYATTIPGLTFPRTTPFDVAGQVASPAARPSAGLVVASAEYFAVTGIPIVAGRAFVSGDAASPEAVAVVSREAARRYWESPAQAVGAVVHIPDDDGRPATSARVIGVAGDTANADLDKALEPVIVVLDAHRPTRHHHLLVRTQAPTSVAPALGAALAGVHPDLTAYRVRTVTDALRDEMSSGRLIGWLFTAFAAVAVLLATAGLYGVLSFVVSQRTPEIAVRLALGASARDITRSVVGQGAVLATAGAALGLLGGLGLASAMGAVLYGVSATDPATYAGAGALALVTALLAAWLPMRRAARVDPIVSLREA